MREIRPSGSEGGVALTAPSLPLSAENRPVLDSFRCSALEVECSHVSLADRPPHFLRFHRFRARKNSDWAKRCPVGGRPFGQFPLSWQRDLRRYFTFWRGDWIPLETLHSRIRFGSDHFGWRRPKSIRKKAKENFLGGLSADGFATRSWCQN